MVSTSYLCSNCTTPPHINRKFSAYIAINAINDSISRFHFSAHFTGWKGSIVIDWTKNVFSKLEHWNFHRTFQPLTCLVLWFQFRITCAASFRYAAVELWAQKVDSRNKKCLSKNGYFETNRHWICSWHTYQHLTGEINWFVKVTS